MAKRKEYLSPFKDDELPTGKYYGALPRRIFIEGVEWRCSATGIVDGVTYDRLRNIETGEFKTVQRKKLLKFLEKNTIK